MKYLDDIIYFVWIIMAFIGSIMEFITTGEGMIITILAMIWHTIRKEGDRCGDRDD
jgi:hypothetical protein